jgi:hypothetical protein
MKNLLLFIAGFLLFTTSTQAQITINAEDINPLGLVGIQNHDTLPDATIVPGGTGLQSWDFSALKDNYSDTLSFASPATTPYGINFPNATMAVKLDTSIYIYIEKTNDRFQVLGSYGELYYDTIAVTTGIYFTPPQSIIRFPANLNDAYTENFRAVIQVAGAEINVSFDSVRLVSFYEREVKIDAYGELKTPAGTFETLRSTETERKTDSIYIKSGPIWFPLLGSDPFTIVYSNWWTNQNGLGFPVVQINYYPDDGHSEVSWLESFFTPAIEHIPSPEITIYPNPVSDFLTVQTVQNLAGTIEIYDMNGRRLASKLMQGPVEKMDIQALVSGSYLLIFKNERGKMTGFKRFSVQ